MDNVKHMYINKLEVASETMVKLNYETNDDQVETNQMKLYQWDGH